MPYIVVVGDSDIQDVDSLLDLQRNEKGKVIKLIYKKSHWGGFSPYKIYTLYILSDNNYNYLTYIIVYTLHTTLTIVWQFQNN